MAEVGGKLCGHIGTHLQNLEEIVFFLQEQIQVLLPRKLDMTMENHYFWWRSHLHSWLVFPLSSVILVFPECTWNIACLPTPPGLQCFWCLGVHGSTIMQNVAGYRRQLWPLPCATERSWAESDLWYASSIYNASSLSCKMSPTKTIGNTHQGGWFVKNPMLLCQFQFWVFFEHHLKLAIPLAIPCFPQIFEGSDCSRFRLLKQYTPENKHDNGKTRKMIRIEDGSPIKHGDFHWLVFGRGFHRFWCGMSSGPLPSWN